MAMTFKSMRYTYLSKNHFIHKNKTSTEQHPNKKRDDQKSILTETMLMRDQRAMIIRHIHYASERETQTETQEKQASEELQSEEEKCMEADVHQHGTSQAAREES